MAAAVVDGVSSMAKHMFDGLVNEYYGRKKGNVKPWTKAHLRRVIQFINGANLAYEIGHKRSNAEIYFSKCYEVLSVDGVQRVVTKRARDDGSVKIMLAKEEYFDILQAYHEKMGHVGYDKLCSVVRERFTLPRHVIGMFVSCCNVCKHCKVPAGIRTTRKRKASSVTSKGSSGKVGIFQDFVTVLVNIIEKSNRVAFECNEKGKSELWKIFKLITVDGERQHFAWCCRCKAVITYVPRTGTGSLIRHKCTGLIPPASPYLKNKEKRQNSISSFDRLPDSNFLNVEDSESSGDFDLRDLRGNFVASMQYSPRVALLVTSLGSGYYCARAFCSYYFLKNGT
ncbi:Uncharacterized protein GBIM_00449 [Gryllus bimaculatus]|nr:Uncharacterized protein GBIM_00449 [Gryllus bimaculatus]